MEEEESMMEPLVSVVIPTYRRSDRIARCLESALAQTCSPEVIVVDDNGRGSEEQLKTEAVVKNYLERGVIYLVNQENRRASYSRNRGLEIAKGKYITLR